ncbi:unnamed protein product [Linum tenue]|uniref:Uncharacterized protein n=1 Tax=Linum tenue TaxID=586396 RepID=A0AAV0P3W3_9ROSI|nr:unnamed protein product [Linum tenue]
MFLQPNNLPLPKETSASGVGSSLHQIAFRFGSVRGCTVRSTTLKWLPLLLVMIQRNSPSSGIYQRKTRKLTDEEERKAFLANEIVVYD